MAGTQRLVGHGNLNYAVADAKSLIDSLLTQEGKRYAKVNTLLIADGESLAPTADNIRRNLSFLDRAGDRDARNRSDEITAILEGQGRRLLLIDACNSGGVDSNRMIRGFMESNAFVFASSQGSECP